MAGWSAAHRAFAQGADTLALAHQLTNAKAFGKAAALLAHYEQAHPTNIEAARLHLQRLVGRNCAVAIGANCTFRRAALAAAGGHGVGLAEDLIGAIRLHAAG